MHKRNWSLKGFVKDKGMDEAKRVMKLTSRAGVYYAYTRGIKIVETEDMHYEVWISELQRRVPINDSV